MSLRSMCPHARTQAQDSRAVVLANVLGLREEFAERFKQRDIDGWSAAMRAFGEFAHEGDTACILIG